MALTVVTNLPALSQVRPGDVELHVVPYPERERGALDRLRALWSALGADYVLINCSPNDLFEICALKLAAPFSRCRIVSLDTVLPVPPLRTFRQRASLWVKKLLFRQPALFIEYFRQTEGYERHYGIPRERFRYVPFKINRYERVLETPTRDEGYVFCGGNTRRDFRTLIEAVGGLSIPVRIVTMAESVISGHGSTLDDRALPPNVEVVRHDGSESFVDHIAGARFVVLPIRRENISASGIGVYLTSMALGKCVVISEGPAVNGVVPEGAAVIVPPEDPTALRAAIARLDADARLRESVAEAGRRYALSLEGENRLYGSIVACLLDDHHQRSRGSGLER